MILTLLKAADVDPESLGAWGRLPIFQFWLRGSDYWRYDDGARSYRIITVEQRSIAQGDDPIRSWRETFLLFQTSHDFEFELQAREPGTLFSKVADWVTGPGDSGHWRRHPEFAKRYRLHFSRAEDKPIVQKHFDWNRQSRVAAHPGYCCQHRSGYAAVWQPDRIVYESAREAWVASASRFINALGN